MQGRGDQRLASETSRPKPEDECSDRDLDPVSLIPPDCLALCHELSERLTATGNYLGALQRLLEIGHRHGQPMPAEIVDKAASEVIRASHAIHALRRILSARSKA